MSQGPKRTTNVETIMSETSWKRSKNSSGAGSFLGIPERMTLKRRLPNLNQGRVSLVMDLLSELFNHTSYLFFTLAV